MFCWEDGREEKCPLESGAAADEDYQQAAEWNLADESHVSDVAVGWPKWNVAMSSSLFLMLDVWD